eukprot:CAMPEP_0114594182 /NCGR_PEP_ID=MMETSP0125-20121206/15801_1 /TAXON_ID=485358 ORGANISM="Aristerostoma sp., Strain ATCC 50986" /NCGR_SAMPLE_ID=MMETSP0125 /ASSEMBLY_ACC=CAM_ASM_000245 /LENGTH=72 /DNA_ID=CAMNT_0001794155 /DNA_START=306 /DNA_END=524 /DNA_ORIENTATION=+
MNSATKSGSKSSPLKIMKNSSSKDETNYITGSPQFDDKDYISVSVDIDDIEPRNERATSENLLKISPKRLEN